MQNPQNIDLTELFIVVSVFSLAFFLSIRFIIDAIKGSAKGVKEANTTSDVVVSATGGCFGLLGGSFLIVVFLALAALVLAIYGAD